MSAQPTIAELVTGYLDVGITKRRAVHYIVDCHMRSHVARGKGSRAIRRAKRVNR